MGPEDPELLDKVAAGVFDDPIDVTSSRAFLRDGRHHLVVAIDDGMIVGMVTAVHYEHPDKPRPECWINELGVAPSHRGRGIAKALMVAILRVARQAGCAEAWVLTDRANAAAMRVYAGTGGREAERDQVMLTFRLE